uniref:PID domain-containing protein n=1 Tax=Pygocentrus nattereri TaxID=42514 RepID=A0A3B4BY24_PYGNA
MENVLSAVPHRVFLKGLNIASKKVLLLWQAQRCNNFLDRVEVVRPDGMQILIEAVASLQKPNREVREKVKKKKAKVHLFISRSAIDILEHKTKFMLYTCSLSSVSFCAVHQTQPKLFGFIAKHPAVDTFHCYVFQSRKFSHLLVSVIGDAFQASRQSVSLRGSRDLVVEALRHKWTHVRMKPNSTGQ